MFTIYTIKGCPYCENTVLLLKKHKLKFKNIIMKNIQEKAKYKKKHKMETFPQVFYKPSNKKQVKIGGYSDTLEFVELCDYLKTTPYNIDAIHSLVKKLG